MKKEDPKKKPDGRAILQSMSPELRAALKELVRLKRLRDRARAAQSQESPLEQAIRERAALQDKDLH